MELESGVLISYIKANVLVLSLFMEKRRVLLGVTGSVASIKADELVSLLSQNNCEVFVIPTEHAFQFFDESCMKVPVYTDSDESSWKTRGDDVLHVKVYSFY